MIFTSAGHFSIDPERVAPMPALPRLQAELDRLHERSSAANRRHLAHTTEEFLRGLPKAELHLHSTAMADIFATAPVAWEISASTDRKLQQQPKFKGSLEALIADFLELKAGSLESYLKHYDLLKNYIIRDLDAVRYTSYMGAKQAFENGVRILEIRTSIKAGFYGDVNSHELMQQVGYTALDELCARIEGFRKAESESGGNLRCFMIITFRRQESESRSMALLEEVLGYRGEIMSRYGRDYVVGVDVAGQETGHAVKQFENVFREARRKGLKVTAHAGEEHGAGEGSIWDALNVGAQRIGHGTSLFRPTPLLDDSVRYQVNGFRKNAFILSLIFGAGYEMCLTSNRICGAEITLNYKPGPKRPRPVTRAFREHRDYPGLMLFALGSLAYRGRSAVLPIPCTDGIYTLNTNLAREYALAAEAFDLGLKELMAIARYSFRHSFASASVRAWGLKQWRGFAQHYLIDPKYSIPDEEAKKALHVYRQRTRQRLGITPEQIDRIGAEVDQTASYLPDYLRTRFFEELTKLEV